MLCTQTNEEFCPLGKQTVALTAFADVEAGGYGCAVAADDLEYSCSLEGSCPHRGQTGCLLSGQ